MSLLSRRRSLKSNGFSRENLSVEFLYKNNLLDTSGNGKNGTGNNLTYVAGHDSEANSAISFNGTNSDFIIPTNSETQPRTGSFTMSFWMYRVGTGVGVIGEAMSDFDTGEGWAIINVDSSNVRFAIGDGIQPSSINLVRAVPLGSWAWICYELDRDSNLFNVYVNDPYTPAGSTSASSISGSDINLLENPVWGKASNNTLYYSMYLDDLRIFQRKLRQSERRYLYNN